MKTLFKKSLLVLMVVFIAIFTLGVTSKVKAAEVVATFELGANGAASHADGNSKTSYTETVNGYTLEITNATNMYTGARDAKGNSCIKIGGSSKEGSFTISVPDDVTSVVIYAAKYKANTSKIKVNGTAYTLSNNSNDGAYDEITVVTTTTKSISVASISGGYRCMINTIEFSKDGSGETPHDPHNDHEKCPECGLCLAEVCDVEKCPGHENNEPEQNASWIEVTDVSDLKLGDKVIIAAVDTAVALSTTQNTNNRGQASVTRNENTITFGDDVQILTLEEGTVKNTYAFYTGSGYLYAASSSSNNLKTQGTNNANGSWSITIADGTATIVAQGSNTRNTMQYNSSSSLFACYASASQKAICLYKQGTVVESDPNVEAFVNNNKSYMTMAYKYSVDSKDVKIPSNSTITFDNKNKRTVYTTTKQVWEENYITITNEKGESTADVGDYGAPARFYKDSTLTISYITKISKVIFYCSNSEYVTNLSNGEVTNTTLEVESTDNKVVLSLDDASDSISISLTGGKVFLNSIEVVPETASNTVQVEAYSNVDFRFRCGVDAALEELEGAESYGIQVTANGKTVKYKYDENVAGFGTSKVVENETEKEIIYVTLGLGDLINDNRLGVEFTVQAFAVVNGVTYVSEFTKTYSIASMVEEYYKSGITEVEGLYNLLVEKGLIEITE